MELKFFLQILCLVFFLSKVTTSNPLVDDDLVVQLSRPVGKIRGHILKSNGGRDYYAFQDIPYAGSTAGKNRFRPPRQVHDWESILNTTSNQIMCPQAANPIYTLKQSEDCLLLSVYSPVKPSSNASLPVYFWIHGGAFNSGYGAMYGAKYFMDYDIVVVIINYRVGVLGFLTTNDKSIPGNLGLKDQHFALRWTYDNIKVFGGDPKQITVGGESAGGMSVGYQLLSKKNQGLMRAVIQQSGSSLNTFAFQIDYREHAFNFGKLINPSFTSKEPHDLLLLLQEAAVSDIIDAQNKMVTTEQIGFMRGSYWKPIIECSSNPDAFVTGPMGQDFVEGNYNRVPSLIGFNSEESVFFFKNLPEAEINRSAILFDENPTLMISNKLHINEEYKEKAALELKRLYTNESFLENKAGFVRYGSDACYIHPATRQADLTSSYTPVYLYKFSYGEPVVRLQGIDNIGHADELKYFFSVLDLPIPVNETIRKALLKFWVNFITVQNPTPVEDEDLQNVIWPLTQTETLPYLNINGTFGIETNPRQYQESLRILDKLIIPPYTVY